MNKKVKFKAIDFSKDPRRVTIDNKEVFVSHYECQDAIMYFRYKSIDSSLEMCLQSIKYIRAFKNNTKSNSINLDAHHTSMFVHYGRCFGKGKLKLEANKVPKQYQKTHDKVINLRHQYIAHLGGDGEGSVNYVALNPNSKDKRIIRIIPPIPIRVRYFNDELLQDLESLVLYLRKFASKKTQLHFDRICKEITDIDIDKLYKAFEDFDLKESVLKNSISRTGPAFQADMR